MSLRLNIEKHVDFLSRNPLPDPNLSNDKVTEVRVEFADITDKWWLAEQRKDEENSELVTELQNKELQHELAKTYELRSGMLHRRIQRNGRNSPVSNTTRLQVVHNKPCPRSCDAFRVGKDFDKDYTQYWFQNMSKYVKNFLENCNNIGKTPNRIALHA